MRTHTTVLLTAACTSVVTALTITAWGGAAMPSEKKLENERVKVTEASYVPGTPRPRYTRPTDQIVVFLDDCKYERKDSQTNAIEIRHRKAGDVIWHSKGEDAPQLTNLGSKPYRTLVIELK